MFMRAIVVTDIHKKASTAELVNKLAEKHNADVILILGDFFEFGPVDFAVDYIRSLKRPVYALPGNCDSRALPETIAKVATDMHGKTVIVNGTKIAGLGGSNPTIFNTPFELTEDEIFDALDPICGNAAILMVHAPAFGHLDRIPNGMRVGSESIKRIVDKHRPAVVLSGHIHEERGIEEANGTLFMNPGAAKEGYAALLVIEKGNVTAELLTL
jgi:Icc-related predicted phosphoesterase